ncbi:RICIN domain-containing protein [Wenjunlia tyrosinilytica]|jgi:hypothetical protein|nr:RICIN domain-containing protein [Wenjunlia tyrosinilytica]
MGSAVGLAVREGRAAKDDDRPSADAPASPSASAGPTRESGGKGASRVGLSLLSREAGGKCLTAVKRWEELRPEAAECGSRPAQSWAADEEGRGRYRLRNRITNACLTFAPTPDASEAAPVLVQESVDPVPSLEVCRNHDGRQHFHFIPLGDQDRFGGPARQVRVVNAGNGRALEVGGDGTSLVEAGPGRGPRRGWVMRVTTRP